MIEKYSFSKAGNKHENEDEISVKEHIKDKNVILCSLADGQGGQFGGGQAAKVAVEKSIEIAMQHSIEQLTKRQIWETIISLTDEAVSEEKQAGYTTLVSLCVIGDWVYGASVGDSAAFALSSGTKILLTDRQRKNPPVGSSGALAEFFCFKLIKPWKLLIMSDGVWKYVGWDCIFNISSSFNGQLIIDNLFSSLMGFQRNYLPDDFSIVLLQDLF